MFLLFENLEIGAVGAMLMAIPESVGIFACGLGLIGGAVLTRWLIGGKVNTSQEGDKN